ncbi:hypothetical protein ASD11_11245 [Aeromicrobium sp. Root495]|uniref:ATP-binding cassette domain-containing protein n=1 Tax=Aeromicrobium sp. Root495 TaxID=1736550 RepID=UPI0006F3D34A|nr:ATP-binding cassette domain-containing protein [Aeromicrobium sp. Root495]KQY60065.1 hypothetical protein ASD11_11245 [Aeromicrobium sp. Root495]
MTDPRAVRITVDGAVVLEVTPGQEVVIGRDPAGHVVVPDHLVSRRHARVVHEGVWVLEDLGSANGTWIHGQEIQRVSLVDAHDVLLGDPADAPLIRLDLVDPLASHTLDRRTLVPADESFRAPSSALPGTTSGTVTIGRHVSNDLSLEDPMVSTRHARVETRHGERWIIDLGSTNQTIVNGSAVAQQRIVDGDKVLIGNTHFRVQRGGLVPESAGGLVVRDAVLAIRSGRRIVDQVSFAVEEPSVVAVIGPSGAGKSSLLRLLTGQVRPTSGSVDFREASMASQRQAFRGDIGVVPQHTIAHGKLTARQALDYTARLRFADDVTVTGRHARVDEVLDQLGLTQHAETPVDRLSGGQQRRVAIAMELLTEPTMLILDEPTSGLDPSLVLQIMQLLRQFADDGKQVLVVTHDLDHLDLVDEVIVLRAGGTVAFRGPPSEVFGHFGRASWAEVFTDLAVPTPATPGRDRIDRPASTASFDVPAPPLDAGQITRRALTVASRHVRLILADKPLVALTLGMPVLLAVLALAVPGSHGLAPLGTEPDPNPGRLLAILTIGAAFLGLAGSIRELVGERAIFLHERDAGLPPLSYLIAKTAVLAAVVVVQSILLVAVVLLFKKDPSDSIFFMPAAAEILVAVSATSVCCMLLGLAVSARLGNPEQSTPPLVLLVMAQLVLCGGLFPIAGRLGLEQLAWLAPGRWGYAAAAATTDLNRALPPEQHDALWNHEVGIWIACLVMLVILSTVLWLISFTGVRRRAAFS